MGGTWVSHVHGRLFAEMQRYGLKDSVSMTRTEGGGAAYFTIDTGSFTAKGSNRRRESDIDRFRVAPAFAEGGVADDLQGVANFHQRRWPGRA